MFRLLKFINSWSGLAAERLERYEADEQDRVAEGGSDERGGQPVGALQPGSMPEPSAAAKKRLDQEAVALVEQMTDIQKSTALFRACVKEDVSMILRLLRVGGFDVDAKNMQGQTAKEVAFDRQKYKAARAFEDFARKPKLGPSVQESHDVGSVEASRQLQASGMPPAMERRLAEVFTKYDRDKDGENSAGLQPY